MPVTLVGLNGYLKLKNAGVSKVLLDQFQAKKAKIDVKPDGIWVNWNGHISQFAVQSIALDPKYPILVAVIAEIEAWLQGILNGATVDATSKAAPPDTSPVVKPKMEAPPPSVAQAVSKDYQTAVNTMIKHPPVPISSLVKMIPVALADAVGLYRPVKGTSPNSRYFMVAVFPTVNMAVKINGQTMSTRVEPTGFNIISASTIKKLTAMGMTSGQGYFSSHASIPDVETAQQFYGAMVAALGGSLLPMADLSLITAPYLTHKGA